MMGKGLGRYQRKTVSINTVSGPGGMMTLMLSTCLFSFKLGTCSRKRGEKYSQIGCAQEAAMKEPGTVDLVLSLVRFKKVRGIKKHGCTSFPKITLAETYTGHLEAGVYRSSLSSLSGYVKRGQELSSYSLYFSCHDYDQAFKSVIQNVHRVGMGHTPMVFKAWLLPTRTPRAQLR